jgi:DNA-binding MurR/RpiR family transcriptional regulator
MMDGNVRERLVELSQGASKVEKVLANYMLANLESLPFETAASLGEKAGVSEPSVGRFCRALGFRHFKDLKTSLKDDIGNSPWLIGDRLRDYRERSLAGDDVLADGLQTEIAAIVRNYEIAQTEEWKQVVERLAHVPYVYVAAFQTERGLGHLLAHLLEYLRPGVRLLDLADGTFTDLLLSEPGNAALVIIELRHYSVLAQRLSAEAKKLGVPVTLITDSYCDWGRDVASEMFAVQTDLHQFWDSSAPIASLISLLVNGVFNEIGPSVEERITRVSALYGRFIGHTRSTHGTVQDKSRT